MNVRDIPRAQWPAFLHQFSRTHRAWLATIDADASGADTADAHPLRSITPFVYNDRVVHIDIRFQDDPQTNAPIRITAPGTVRVDETWEGVAQALEIIDSHGISTRVRFRVAPRAAMLDGMTPGEMARARARH